MIDYEQFPGLDGFYLEDSFVLAITETPSTLTFTRAIGVVSECGDRAPMAVPVPG